MPEVFVSYAHADNQVMVGRARGWVTTFADRLQKMVAQKPGGSGIKVWMDHRLEPQKAVDAALTERVGRAVCFLALMSPRYLESSWCREEMAGFVARHGGVAADRVFLVEMLPTERGTWHAGIQSITAMPFWSQAFEEPAPMTLGWPVPLETDSNYWHKLNELAHFLASQLKAGEHRVVEPVAVQRRVWIADPTDHVLDAWDDLAAAVRQQGGDVLPSASGQYPIAAEADFRSALGADLEGADLLVQLFGPHPGRKPAWAAAPLSRVQAEVAQAIAARRGVPYLAWRSPEVVLDAIASEDHRKLVTGSIACSFADLQSKVSAHLKALAATSGKPGPSVGAPTPGADAALTICVNADQPDRGLGEQVRDMLYDELGVDVNLAAPQTPDQSPALWRRDYEAQLQQSHGLVIVYGQAPPSWVQAQVQAAKKTLALARRGVWGAVLDGPPPGRPDHGVRSRSLMAIDCRAGLAREPLARFVDALRSDQVIAAGGVGRG